MRIHSISKILLLPLAVAAAYIIYRAYNSSDYTDPLNYWLLPIAVIGMIIHLMKPQIDHWWHKKNPPKLAPFISDWLNKYSSFYNGLSEEDKAKFRERLSIYLESREFTLMREEAGQLPEDFKAIAAHNIIQLTFGQEDYLLDPYERVVAYSHAFPSPKMQFLHTVEVDDEDGVIILSTEHLFPGMINQENFYNIGMHAYVEAFLSKHKKASLPSLPEDITSQLEKISKHQIEKVKATIGYDVKNMHIMAITYFFTFPSSFKEELPNLYDAYATVFNQRP